MCLYAAVIKIFFNLNISRWIEYTTNKLDLKQIHLECYIGESVKSSEGWQLCPNPHFRRKMAVCFVGLQVLWIPTLAAGPRGLRRAQTLGDSLTAVRRPPKETESLLPVWLIDFKCGEWGSMVQTHLTCIEREKRRNLISKPSISRKQWRKIQPFLMWLLYVPFTFQ